MKKIVLCLLFLLSQNLFSFWDYKVSSAFRSAPRGLYLGGEVGKSFLIWGDQKEDQSFKYGYFRTYVFGSSSFLVNSMEAAIEFYPISFLSIQRGFGYIIQDYNKFHLVDCEQNFCKGNIKRDFWGVKLTIGFNDFYWINHAKWHQSKMTNHPKETFYDSFISLLVKENVESIFSNLAILGKRFNESYSVGLISLYQQDDQSSQQTHLLLSNVSLDVKKKKYTLALGFYRTPEDKLIFSGLINFSWNISTGLQLY